MIASPQIAKILSNFDETLNDYGESTLLYSHHENTTFLENMFKKDFKNYQFEKAENPFFEDTEILFTIVTKNVKDTSASKSVL